MRKIYLLLVMLASFFTGSTFAQAIDEKWAVDVDNPIITDASQLSSPWSDPSEGADLGALIDENTGSFWHTSWHSEPPHNVMGSHYLQVEMPEGYYDMEEYKKIVFKVTRRGTNNNHPTLWSVYGTNETIEDADEEALAAFYANPIADRDKCTLIGEFSTPLTSTGDNASGEVHVSDVFDPQGFKYLRFYVDETASTNGGEHNAVFWHAAEFNLYPIKELDPWEVAFNSLSETIEKYNYYSFDTGEYPGQYSDDLANAFYDALDEAIGLINESEASIEEMQAAEKAIIDGYEAVIASRVPFVMDITEGYYRIRGAMKYVNNVVIDQDEEGNDITEEQEVDKYLYSVVEGGKIWGRWNTPADLTTDCPSLWKITPLENGNFALVNMATDARFNPVARSANAEMSIQDTTEIVIVPVGYDIDAEQTIMNLHVAPLVEDGDDYEFLHQGGHSSGAGVSGSIVGWCTTISENTPGASEWFLDRVSEDEAQAIIEEYAPIKDHDLMVDSYKTMLADAKVKLAEAQDIQKLVEDDKPLITDAGQFFSPFSQNDLGGKDGDDLSSGVLIDGKTDNFWHTYWGGGNAANGSHYLQVEMPDGYYDLDEVNKEIVLKFTRRSGAANDHTTKWLVVGLNEDDEEIAKEDCDTLATLLSPYASTSETIVTEPFDPQGFKYLRFYSEEQYPSSRGYWHVAEFQLYPGHLYQSPTCQYALLGDIAVNLENVINEQADIDVAELTVAQYTALKDAYEAFIDKFVDPAELRQAIAAVEGKSGIVVVGENPGFWPDNSTATTLEATIAAAKAYDEAGVYIAETSEKFIADLNAQAEAIEPAAIPIQTGKWYRLRFGKEEEYEQYGWPTAGDDIDNRIVDEEVVGMYNEALFGKYVTVANFEEEQIDTDDNGNPVNGHRVVPIEKEDIDDICIDHYLFVDDDEDIIEKDLSLFRFISVGDSAFAIQNKATGLFFTNPNGDIRLSVHPTLFMQHIAGYGQNAFFSKRLNGEETSPLHVARNYNILSAWGGVRNGYGNSDGRRGCFFVEEVEDVAPDYAPVDFKINMKLGALHGFCYPMEIEGPGMYSIGSVEVKEEGGVAVTLVPIAKAEAGRPFIHVNDGTFEIEDDDAAPVSFKHGYDIVANPIDNNTLKGVFYETEIGKGFIVPTDGEMKVTIAGQKAGYNRAYIAGDGEFERGAAVTFTIDVEGEDGIAAALEKVAKNGALYTLDGQLVNRSANLNSLRNMPKGVYILNGVKVAVK